MICYAINIPSFRERIWVGASQFRVLSIRTPILFGAGSVATNSTNGFTGKVMLRSRPRAAASSPRYAIRALPVIANSPKKAARTLDAMLCHGTGTIEAKSGYGLDMETELKQLDVMDVLSRDHAVDIHQTFLGAHEVPPEYAGKPRAYIDFLNQELLPRVKDRGAVTYVDIFCEKGVFELEDTRRHLEAALDQGFKLRVHADELYPLGGTGLAAELGAVTADHLVHCSEQDRRKMAEAGTMPILLPGTSFFLRARYADAAAFKDVGCAIALSTDYNPGSSHTISQPLMMALACMKMGLTFEESFIAVTLNAAASLGVSNEIGTLEAGKKADIAFLDAPSAMHLVYYWGVNHVSDVLKAGKFVVRNKALVA